jgi:hypothetical protein
MNSHQKMSAAQAKIALVLRVRPGDVKEISPDEVLQRLKDRIHHHVLEVTTEVVGARFWRFGAKFFFEDPEEEDPINFDDLRYDSEIGLHSVDEIDDQNALK